MTLIEDVRESWSWVGLNPVRIIKENDFGNLIILDEDGKVWRLCPEELYCEIISLSLLEFESIKSDKGFLNDWEMNEIKSLAIRTVGPLDAGRKYCLKIPVIFGGRYELDNLAAISLSELIRLSGDLAHQIRDLPDGSKIELKVTK